MANLQILSVKFNSIRSLEDYLIPGFSRLIKLDLRENPLMDRPPHWKVINHQQKINRDTLCFKYMHFYLLILLLLFSVTYVKSTLFTYRDWISYCWEKCDLLKKQFNMRWAETENDHPVALNTLVSETYIEQRSGFKQGTLYYISLWQ